MTPETVPAQRCLMQHDSGQAGNMSVESLMVVWHCVTTDKLFCLVTKQRGFSGDRLSGFKHGSDVC